MISGTFTKLKGIYVYNWDLVVTIKQMDKFRPTDLMYYINKLMSNIARYQLEKQVGAL